MLHSLDARCGRLLTNSLYTQTSGAELHPAFNRGSPHCIARVLPVRLALVLFCKSHRAISERPVTPRVESIKPHSLSELRKHSEPLSLGSLDDCATIPDGGSRLGFCRDRRSVGRFHPDLFSASF